MIQPNNGNVNMNAKEEMKQKAKFRSIFNQCNR